MKTKTSLFLFLLLFAINNYCQNNFSIKGKVSSIKHLNDSIIFRNGPISENYYEKKLIEEKVVDGRFNFKLSLSYPHMYFLAWSSERNKIPFYFGSYFFDSSGVEIQIDSTYEFSKISGKTANEYNFKFTPFMLKDNNDIKNYSISKLLYEKPQLIDSKLVEYTKLNKNSYVALWFLIYQFNQKGQKNIYEQILNSFSSKMQSEKLWKIVNEEFQNIKIKENQKFPNLLLQNTDLQLETVTIPNAKYTLVDFWFSRCRPCLEEMPKWINLYNIYKDKGFNIIGISSDKTENVKPYWQKRIVERGIPWKNYLDENAVFCTSEKINSFPTNFLLNEKGEVIQKNIEPEDLEKILNAELK